MSEGGWAGDRRRSMVVGEYEEDGLWRLEIHGCEEERRGLVISECEEQKNEQQQRKYLRMQHVGKGTRGY